MGGVYSSLLTAPSSLSESLTKPAISGLEKASSNEKYAVQRASNFLEWIYSTFGDGIAELFMIPYNRKVWGVPLEFLDYAWIGDRVAVPSIEQISRSLDSKLDHNDWGPNQQFWYPTFGGTGSIGRGCHPVSVRSK